MIALLSPEITTLTLVSSRFTMSKDAPVYKAEL